MARNGTTPSKYIGYSVHHLIAPYGMRKISGYGENTWEFFNRQYDVIGLPFTLARKPSKAQIQAVADKEVGENPTSFYFYADGSYGTSEYWKRIAKVMRWKLKDGQLERSVPSQEPPHSYSVREKTSLDVDEEI